VPSPRHQEGEVPPFVSGGEPADAGDGYATNPSPNPSPTRHLAETVDGPGYLSGNRQEQNVTLMAHARKEALRDKIGVVLLSDGVERFYYPFICREKRIDTDERQ
jgi:hypothetical protein